MKKKENILQVKVFICNICEKILSFENNLRRHIFMKFNVPKEGHIWTLKFSLCFRNYKKALVLFYKFVSTM